MVIRYHRYSLFLYFVVTPLLHAPYRLKNSLLDSKKIIDQILRSAPQREQAILQIARDAKLKSDIESYVKRNSGTDHDAKTIFHDAIIIFVKKVFSQEGLELENTTEGYLFGITKKLWSNTLRSRSKKNTLELDDKQSTIASDENTLMELMSAEKRSLLETVLSSIGEKCRQVLVYWSYGHSMKVIAEKLNYASDGMARKKKHQCLQKLKEIITSNESLRQQLNH